MLNFKGQDNRKWRNIALQALLVISTVLIIVWFLPHREVVRFHYEVGKPWMYSSFIAKFDFPIYKTEEALRAEQDSVARNFDPYYTYDMKVETNELNKLRADFKNDPHEVPAAYLPIILNRLHRLYQAGIMNTPEYNNLAKDSNNQLRLINGKEVQSIPVRSVFSTMSAYEQIFLDERLMSQRQALQKLNLNDYIEPNLIYDKERSQSELNDLLSGISPASGMVLSGQKVIDRGELVNDYDYRVLSSFEREMQRRNANEKELTNTLLGQGIYIAILVLLFTVYLHLFRHDYFENPRSIAMLYVMITIFPILVSLMMKHNVFSVYILPFAMLPIFIRVFMDSRTAFIAHATMVLICAAAVKYQYEFIIIQLVNGLVAIFSLRELSKRAQVFKTALLVTIASCITFFSLQLMEDSDTAALDAGMYTHFAVNGVLLLSSYPLMFLIERVFGFVSNVTLFELSNTNRGILRDLSEIAPGTFQHSITVANLAAEIANKIGAKSLLVRTGALYHDIGKMKDPVFFTENQAGVNPHDNMTNLESAQIIIGHVTEGVKLAEKSNLPNVIKDFILTHHGHGVAKYFYIKEQNAHPDEKVDPEPFTYPGPNPFTREQAILMMSDAVEAASRSLKEYTEESISHLVNTMVDQQVADGFFTECPITFRDISLAKQVLIERLKAIYHTRIQYPTLNK